MEAKHPTAPAIQPPQASALAGSRPRTVIGLTFLLGVFTCLLLQQAWVRMAGAGQPAGLLHDHDVGTARRESAGYLVDLNQAGAKELEQVRGIGPVLAGRIVADREQRGPFASVEEVTRVRGVGPATLERLRARCYVLPPASDAVRTTFTPRSAGEMSEQAAAAGTRKTPPPAPIDLNRATRQELMQLPSIAGTLADRILEDRRVNGPYRRVEDIMRVRGIKGRTLEKLREHVFVLPPDSAADVPFSGADLR